MCAIENECSIHHYLSILSRMYKHSDINSFVRSYIWHRILFFIAHCFVQFNRTFWIWMLLWKREDTFEKAELFQPIFFSFNKSWSAACACATDRLRFNNCLNINYYIKRSKCSSKIIHSNYSRNSDLFFYFFQ